MGETLEILYQDEWLVAVNKPAGHLVHPADHPQDDDLVAMKILRDQLGKQVYTVHRLDRPTCGILLFGIEEKCTKELHRAFEYQEVEKTYHAIVDGFPKLDTWTCEEPIQKDETKPFRHAKTSFKVLERAEVEGVALALVECKPHTGRFHQIRRHLLAAGYPIVGDYRYAGIERSEWLTSLMRTQKRMMLQARKLVFQHPISLQTLVVELGNREFAPVGWKKVACDRKNS